MWFSELDLLFVIELFHGHECLWIVSSANYHKKERRPTAMRAMSVTVEERTPFVFGGNLIRSIHVVTSY